MVNNMLPYFILFSGTTAIISLLALHVLSPEFKPSWRMISEYAIGKYKTVLTTFFLLWGLGTIATALLLWDKVNTTWSIIGVILIALSGIGACMGGLFDIKHKLHGASFALGVPTLPIGALLVTYNLLPNYQGNHSVLIAMTHALWISVVLMAVSMAVLFSGFKKKGLPMGPDATPPEILPNGIIALNGYANRLLVICYITYILLISNQYL
jgi:Protein of unknown function (DUF998)